MDFKAGKGDAVKKRDCSGNNNNVEAGTQSCRAQRHGSSVLQRGKAHREVERADMLGQRADRDIVDAGLRNLRQRRFGHVA